MFTEYLSNYDKVSSDDRAESIVDSSYSQSQVTRMLGYLGDVSGLRICDVGVGPGYLFEALLNRKTERLVGVDISAEYLRRWKGTAGEMFLANAENLPFSSEFDLLVASDILEHVLNPADFLVSANRALLRKGLLVVRVPFEEDPLQYSRLLGCKYKFVHLRNFSRENLRSMLEFAGFGKIQFRYDGFYAYRLRNFITKRPHLRHQIERLLQHIYPNPHSINSIPYWLGTLLMKPLEIVAIAEKTRDLEIPKSQSLSH